MTVTNPPEFPASSAPVPPPLKPSVKTGKRGRSFASLRTITALMLREMSTTYGKSPGGYLWALLEPLGGIFIMVLIFSTGFRTPPIGSNFAIFFATGIVPFAMFGQISNRMGSSLLFSKNLLAYPAVTYVDALIARFLLNVTLQLLVSYILITGIIISQDVPVVLRFSRIFLGYAEIIALAAGIGLFNAFLGGMFPVWNQIWSIITRPLFLVSGVLFIYETLPRPINEYMLYNPLTHAIATIRSGFYARYDAAYADPVFVFTVAGIAGITGLVFLHRYHKDILYR